MQRMHLNLNLNLKALVGGMIYHAPSNQFVVGAQSLEAIAYNLRHALAKIRVLAGLPLDKYTRESRLTDACSAQIAVIEAAECMGIDIGVPRMNFNELDLRGVE